MQATQALGIIPTHSVAAVTLLQDEPAVRAHRHKHLTGLPQKGLTLESFML